MPKLIIVIKKTQKKMITGNHNFMSQYKMTQKLLNRLNPSQIVDLNTDREVQKNTKEEINEKMK